MDRLIRPLRRFNAQREWECFQCPKNLAMGILIEAPELAEHFQWLTEEQSRHPTPEAMGAIRDEIGDVVLYLVNLSDTLGIDPLQAAWDTIEKDRQNYPVDRSRGRASKPTR